VIRLRILFTCMDRKIRIPCILSVLAVNVF
jgi:hypothetical protein